MPTANFQLIPLHRNTIDFSPNLSNHRSNFDLEHITLSHKTVPCPFWSTYFCHVSLTYENNEYISIQRQIACLKIHAIIQPNENCLTGITRPTVILLTKKQKRLGWKKHPNFLIWLLP